MAFVVLLFRLPESLCIIARCLRDVMAADLKIAPVTCVQKVVLHTDKIVFALEACAVVFAIDPTCSWFHFPTLPQTPIQVSMQV